MKKKYPKNHKTRLISNLREDELSNSGVGKVLLGNNKKLQTEVDALKRSLKNVQNELENLRSQNHTLDKENNILNYRLTTAFFPELLKFIASSIGAGFAISFFFNGQIKFAAISFVISVLIYSSILFLYRK